MREAPAGPDRMNNRPCPWGQRPRFKNRYAAERRARRSGREQRTQRGQDTAPKRPKGEGAPEGGGGAGPPTPNEGRGRTTAPGPSAGSPTRRAASTGRKPDHPNQTKSLVLFKPRPSGRGGFRRRRTKQNTDFVCVRPPPPRRTSARRASDRFRSKKFRKREVVGWKNGGVLRHPPIGALCFVRSSHVTAVTCDQICVDFVCLAWYYL